jgi:ABC-2 type transport system ATP-binding protein
VLGAALVGEGEIRVEFNGDAEAQTEVVRALVQGGHGVMTFREQQADLEDVFLKLTTGAVN